MIPLCKPATGINELQRIIQIIKSGYLTAGPANEEFEENFSKYIGVKYAQTVNSCASALFVVLKALNIKGEVIIPSFTFVATVDAVIAAGATPVFADIDYDSGNVTAKTIKPLINERTEAVMPVHFAGQSCQMDEIVNLCEQYKLTLIEDSAEAIGATYKNKKTGSFGIGCFSFFPTKNITTGEGGMITTNDNVLMHKIKILIAHGIDKNQSTEYKWQREAVVVGYNLRMSSILAGIGIEQLKKLDYFNNLRRHHSQYLSEHLDKELIQIPQEQFGCKHTYQMYTVRVNPKIRNKLVEELNRVGIGASVHFSPAVHQQKIYQKYRYIDLANTEKLAASVITLPMYPDLTKDDLDYIIKNTNQSTKKLYGTI